MKRTDQVEIKEALRALTEADLILQKEVWKAHAAAAGEFNSRGEQMEALEWIGKLAKAIQAATEARKHLHE